jgi:ketosteroid isomerase-like protein
MQEMLFISYANIMNTNEGLIRKFYTAFSNRDYVTMQNCYHPDATFSDSVFRNLNSEEVKAMWHMLLSSSHDLKLEFSDVKADDKTGSCRWDAWYTFSQTKRNVHNIIHVNFKFKDGLIIDHQDYFDFWRWSRMALGTSGLLLGWTSFLKNKVRRAARERLKKFMEKQ